jgi:hypothetical protein
MDLFLWAMIVLLALSAINKLWWVVTDFFPPRTRGVETADLVINVLLMVWAVVLLNRA